MGAQVEYAVSSAIATITPNRPEKLNAFNVEIPGGIGASLDLAECDDGVHAVVLTGESRAFSSGQDLSVILSYPNLEQLLERDYAPLVTRLFELPKVTVAALNGPAAGAAVNLALACDSLVAAQSACLHQAFVNIGLIPDVACTWLLPRMVG